MCGIAALWGATDDSLIEDMLDLQGHRGPDGRGLESRGSEAMQGRARTLGHARLAIIDPEGGAQPLHDTDGGWSLVANGMIYNDAELRARMRDASWRTRSDSESILRALAEGGPAAVADLDGMFAFVMTDGERLIAARDRVGIKPLYMGRLKGGAASGTDGLEPVVAFASEAKALAGRVDAIEEFPAGHVYDSRTGLRPYYDLPDGRPEAWTLEGAVVALREALERAVEKRLRSDVPFGALLSGGLDSSIIAALAARRVTGLKTFAVGFEGSPDLRAARRVAAHIGSDHQELVITPQEVSAAIPRALYHLESFDQDLVRSALPCWFVCRFAAEQVKVVLTGEGADELFAGYTYYRGIEDRDALAAELRRSIARMHNINLQRVDRMAMAHGLEARVPFLDTEVIALGLSLPVDWKLKARADGRRIEKWVLRKAFEDLLPADIVWRDKLQFDQGSGTADYLMAEIARAADRSGRDLSGARSPEEAYYRALLAETYDSPADILGLVAHWDTRPAA